MTGFGRKIYLCFLDDKDDAFVVMVEVGLFVNGILLKPLELGTIRVIVGEKIDGKPVADAKLYGYSNTWLEKPPVKGDKVSDKKRYANPIYVEVSGKTSIIKTEDTTEDNQYNVHDALQAVLYAKSE